MEVCYHYSSRLGVHSLQGNTVYHISSQKKDIFNSEDYFYKEVLCFKKCLLTNLKNLINLPISCSSGKEPTSQCRRHKRCRFDPWIRKIPWRRKWQPTPVFLPGKSHGQRSLVDYSPWDHKELDTTEQLHFL